VASVSQAMYFISVVFKNLNRNTQTLWNERATTFIPSVKITRSSQNMLLDTLVADWLVLKRSLKKLKSPYGKSDNQQLERY
jgi:hypothetical protein